MYWCVSSPESVAVDLTALCILCQLQTHLGSGHAACFWLSIRKVTSSLLCLIQSAADNSEKFRQSRQSRCLTLDN
ncbi:hypothetical protein M404DRAFT_901420 [Pisolithus tinctorius Marx 270]|uniref:Uncharacterized protein n=1 Tax=Pisolithus tinctorius Marx 270 TaxID=870435 RepID=A0A0C3P9Q5_PISTI|nr:hypothetical protein M404DRAFT_901420 [Pisolithus tinctorius Marx 270]